MLYKPYDKKHNNYSGAEDQFQSKTTQGQNLSISQPRIKKLHYNLQHTNWGIVYYKSSNKPTSTLS